MEILIPCSIGELCDKITILQIKNLRIKDKSKLKNIRKELYELFKIWRKVTKDIEITKELEDLLIDLGLINQKIWNIEDNIRIEEKNKDWGEDFIQLARSVYFKNDKRAEIKRKINKLFDSEIIEEKSYESYD